MKTETETETMYTHTYTEYGHLLCLAGAVHIVYIYPPVCVRAGICMDIYMCVCVCCFGLHNCLTCKTFLNRNNFLRPRVGPIHRLPRIIAKTTDISRNNKASVGLPSDV